MDLYTSAAALVWLLCALYLLRLTSLQAPSPRPRPADGVPSGEHPQGWAQWSTGAKWQRWHNVLHRVSGTVSGA
eukprot:CAMPEP_0174385678 /NCGR_PEP_ID=MMETSP0811_2-20130205/126764_1 /TAXON_ID=73025 ORGANISM="Eutreptiella gymnastica-like, Strain CCMP1594" /NCGR_SAMPLE_ID=MMETSP0811_2 /ASSEMBLY_ACC=CAM_ASM_000667 /LENGTH=73 /DNA_ID=CAMNT_0015540083 /DNA_START=1135 /DNA_END=1356 /DNA_ORIENTATION=+